MKETPIEHVGITDMLFCSVRYDMSGFILRSDPNSKSSATERETKIKNLESHVHRKYLKFCDVSIPLHLFTTYLARGCNCFAKFYLHHPRRYTDKGANLDQSQRTSLFWTGVEFVDLYIQIATIESVKRYSWHTSAFFPLDAMIFVLSELAYHMSDQDISKERIKQVWKIIDQAYELRPGMLNDRGNQLYTALGNLSVKAWSKHDPSNSDPPQFIRTLQSRHSPQHQGNITNPLDRIPYGVANTGMSTFADTTWAQARDGLDMRDQHNDPSQIVPEVWDWDYWQELIDNGALSGFDDVLQV